MNEDDLLKLLTGERTQPIRVCRIRDDQQRVIGAHTSIVWLSRYTASKVETKRRDQQLRAYRLAETIIQYGETRVLAPRHLVILYSLASDPKRPYRAIVKATRTGAEIYLDSVYRIRPAQVAKTLAQTVALSSFVKKKLV